MNEKGGTLLACSPGVFFSLYLAAPASVLELQKLAKMTILGPASPLSCDRYLLSRLNENCKRFLFESWKKEKEYLGEIETNKERTERKRLSSAERKGVRS